MCNNIAQNIKVKEEVMSSEFPSIWFQLESPNGKPICIAGFYRQWSHNGDKSETVTKKCNRVIITGDANLCALKWNDEKYLKNNIAIHYKNAIEQCGLFNQPIGNTFLADHLKLEIYHQNKTSFNPTLT